MKEHAFKAPMSIHCTCTELAEIDAAAAASGSRSRNSFVKSAIAREIERLKLALPAQPAVAPALEADL